VTENKNNKEKNSLINVGNNTVTNNNKTLCLDEISKFPDKGDISPIPNLLIDSTTKIKPPFKQILFLNNEEMALSVEGKKSLNTNSEMKNEKPISERKKNKYKNIMINQNLINNDNNKFSNKK
jgi:hypothetical protein